MADPILALLPESKATYTLDKNLRPVIATLPLRSGLAPTGAVAYVQITTLVSSPGLATARTLYKHGLTTGDEVVVFGADQAEYVGTHTITVIDFFLFTYAISGSPASPATGSIFATFDSLSDDEFAITLCAAKDGGVWILYDALTDRGFPAGPGPILRKFDPETGELIADVVRPNNGVIGGPLLSIGEYGAYKSLMDIGCGNLLTKDRDTGEVLSVKVESVGDGLTPVDPDDTTPDNTVGVVQKRYSLVLDIFDGAVNADASRLFYIVDASIRIWDLDEDAFIRTLVATVPA